MYRICRANGGAAEIEVKNTRPDPTRPPGRANGNAADDATANGEAFTDWCSSRGTSNVQKNHTHARTQTHTLTHTRPSKKKKKNDEKKILQVALVTESNAASVSISAPTEKLVFSQTSQSPVWWVPEAFATSDDDVVVFRE